MEEIGVGSSKKLATQNSFGSLMMNAFGKEFEPLHLIPSAFLTVNFSPTQSFKKISWDSPMVETRFMLGIQAPKILIILLVI
ncbi:hypothetical protein RYX36_035203, partial [Vicia faba]